MGFPGGTVGKIPPASARDTGDAGWIPGPGRSSRVGSGNPLQYSCLENSTDGGAWQATVCGIAESDATEHTRTHTDSISCSYVILEALHIFK